LGRLELNWADHPLRAARAEIKARLGPPREVGRKRALGWSFGAILSLYLLDKVGVAALVAFFIAAAMLLGPLRQRAVLVVRNAIWLVIFPVLATFSIIWSDSPEQTARYSLQLWGTVICALAVASRLSPRQFIIVLFFASLAVCLASLGMPVHGIDGSLIGIMGSKNSLATIAALLFVTAVEFIFDNQQRFILRVLAPLAIALATTILLLSHSAGAVMTVASTTGVFLFFGFLIFFRGRGLAFVLSITALTAILLAVVVTQSHSDLIASVMRFFGKDGTLTGRTYLWGRAAEYISDQPVLGHGFSAFWRQGAVEAEGLWRYAGIDSRAGFNFHNSYIETGVDLGWVGVVLLVFVLVYVFWKGLMRAMFRQNVCGAFLFAILVSMIIRSFGETIFYRQMNYASFIFIVVAAYILRAPAVFGRISRVRAVAAMDRFGVAEVYSDVTNSRTGRELASGAPIVKIAGATLGA